MLIYPDNRLKPTWDVFMFVLLLFSCLITPLQLALFSTLPEGWLWSNRVTDILFLCDIIVTFNSATFDDDFNLNENRGKIAYDYVTGWFLLDFICIVPFDLMF